MDATEQLTMPSTFDLTGFLGYILLVENGKGELRPHVEDDLHFRDPETPVIVVPPSPYPIALLYWDADVQLYRVQTVRPDEARYR